MPRRLVFQISLSLTALLSPALLGAQHAGLAAGGHGQVAAPAHAGAMPVAHAPVHSQASAHPVPAVHLSPVLHSAPRPGPYRASTHTSTSRPRANDLYANPYYPNDYPAPGLGFDYVHYAAVHPSAGHAHAQFRGGAIFPVFGGGFYYPATDYVEPGSIEQPSQDQTDVQPIQSAEAEAQLDEAPIASRRTRPTPAPASPEYIFVRRDGSVFFAVAYSWINGDLQYVTKDGFRKLVSGGTLDLDATTQFNEQRGVSFHSPA